MKLTRNLVNVYFRRVMILYKETNKFSWNTCFVVFPTKCISGEVVFMQTLLRRWNMERGSWCDANGYSGTDGAWEYRLIGDNYG